MGRFVPGGACDPVGRLARGVLRCPQPAQTLWTPGAAGAPAVPGTLGEVPKVNCGAFDLRPWEEPYESPRWNDWRLQAKEVWGPTLTLRITRRQPDIFGGENVFDAQGNTQADSQAYLSVLVSTFNDTIGTTPGDPNIDPETRTPLATRGLWERQTRLGPNLMPELAGVGQAELDVLRWAENARFVQIWLWYYWVNITAPDVPPIDLAWETRDDTPPAAGLTNIVSWPIRSVVDDMGPPPGLPVPLPYAAAAPFDVFRYRRLRSAHRHQLAIVNGSAVPVDADLVQWNGANAYTVTASGGVPVGSFTIVNTVAPDTSSHYSAMIGHTAAGGTAGPIVVSLTASDVQGGP